MGTGAVYDEHCCHKQKPVKLQSFLSFSIFESKSQDIYLTSNFGHVPCFRMCWHVRVWFLMVSLRVEVEVANKIQWQLCWQLRRAVHLEDLEDPRLVSRPVVV